MGCVGVGGRCCRGCAVVKPVLNGALQNREFSTQWDLTGGGWLASNVSPVVSQQQLVVNKRQLVETDACSLPISPVPHLHSPPPPNCPIAHVQYRSAHSINNIENPSTKTEQMRCIGNIDRPTCALHGSAPALPPTSLHTSLTVAVLLV